MEDSILHTIRWELYPLVAHLQSAHDWLDVQSKLGLVDVSWDDHQDKIPIFSDAVAIVL